MNKQHNILIIDDHPIILEGLKKVLLNSSLKFDNIFTAGGGIEGYEILKNNTIDIVISDISMPGMNGLDLSKIIRKEFQETKLAVLSQFEDIQVVKPLLNLNVDAIILKGQDTSEIITALSVIESGEKFYSQQIKELVFNSLSGKPGDKSIIKLSKRETQVLKLIAEEKTSKEISEMLFLSVPTIETYRSNLFRKFDVKNIAGLIRKAMQKGFIQ